MEVAYRKTLYFFQYDVAVAYRKTVFFCNMIWRSRIELTVAYRKASLSQMGCGGSRIENFHLFSQRGSVAYSSSLSYHILSYNVKNS